MDVDRSASRAARVASIGLLILFAAASGCGTVRNWLEGEPESIRQWRTAEELFESEHFARAAVAYRAWLADYRDSEDVLRPFVMYRLGECYRKTRDYERAAEVLTKLVQLHANSPNPYVKELVDKVVKPTIDDIRPRNALEQKAAEKPDGGKPNP